MSSESEIETEDVGMHDAYQTISWTYRFTKEEMIKRIEEKDAWEIFDYVHDKEELAKLTAQQLLDHIVKNDCHEWILGIDYSLDAATMSLIYSGDMAVAGRHRWQFD